MNSRLRTVAFSKAALSRTPMLLFVHKRRERLYFVAQHIFLLLKLLPEFHILSFYPSMDAALIGGKLHFLRPVW